MVSSWQAICSQEVGYCLDYTCHDLSQRCSGHYKAVMTVVYVYYYWMSRVRKENSALDGFSQS